MIRRRMVRLWVVATVLGVSMSIGGVAWAHSHFGQMGPGGNWKDCAVAWEHGHTSSRIESSTESIGILPCAGLNVKIHYKLDGLFFTATAWDTIPPITAVRKSVNGYDVFYWSSHNARPAGMTYWIGGKKYHGARRPGMWFRRR